MSDPRPYHIISYGTLLGTQFFQSFVGGVIAFRALPRPQFASLQTAIFPVYFPLQTALPVVVALTASKGRHLLGLSGLTAPENRWGTLIPPSYRCHYRTDQPGYPASNLSHELNANWTCIETRDGKKSYDAGPHSKEMIELNKKFGRIHGISSLVNLGSFIATIYYGAVLSKKLQ
ncbi:hypothetical protein N7470_010210 [Penicillium chermesinum]|nr:hypothetical protein N7470_010210 [Penicillium chermesinum]